MPIVDVHLWYDRPVLGCDFAALLDSPVQWVFEKSPGYVCCSLSAADDLVQRPERELVELARNELASVLPGAARARLLQGAATRDPDATFIPAPGVRRPGPSTALSNLVIAGAWTDTGWPATIESAVRSGRTAALTLFSNAAGWSSTLAAPATGAAQEVARAV
jgi:hydroxysqualene dehydroxylase